MTTLFFLFLSFSTTGVQAGQSSFPFLCLPGSALESSISDCTGNGVLAEASVQCVELLATQVYLGKRELKKAYSEETNSSQNNQVNSQGKSEKIYARADNVLSVLVASGVMTTFQVHDYLNYLNWPEDVDNPQITGGSVLGFLKSNSCYESTRKTIVKAEETLTKMTANLQAARVKVRKMRGIAETQKVETGIHDPNATILSADPSKNVNSDDLMGIDLRGGGLSGPRSIQNPKK